LQQKILFFIGQLIKSHLLTPQVVRNALQQSLDFPK
jgi:hypothetical protein